MALAEGAPATLLAPSGYSAAINTPTADVLPWGVATFGLSNSNPERQRTIGSGSFGSLNAGVGVLPGVELVGRLAFEGDLHCNSALKASCPAGERDLSVGGKWQLPLDLPFDTRLALGASDFGGATGQYRQSYGVATSRFGALDVSLGYGRASGRQALLDGAFGSAVLRLSDHWRVALEDDSRVRRLGGQYRRRLAPDQELQLGVSRKLDGVASQQPWQATLMLNVALGGSPQQALPAAPLARPAEPPLALQPAPVASVAAAPAAAEPAPAAPVAAAPAAEAAPLSTEGLAQALVDAGFTQVSVRYWRPDAVRQGGRAGVWQVSAEPRRWRKSQLDAMGVALGQWLARLPAGSSDGLLLTLTYQREPVLSAETRADCLRGWLQGQLSCQAPDGGGAEAVRLVRGAPTRLQPLESQPPQQAELDGQPGWMPQLEIGPSLRTAVGTELGLLDHSLALDLGFEAGLARGLFLQGHYSAPLSHSADYNDGNAFSRQRHRAGWDRGMLSYWKALPHGVAAQLSAGQLNRGDSGGQADAVWMNEDGRWRLGATAGRYRRDALQSVWLNPVLGSVRYSVDPGAWQLELLGGRFMAGDEGYKVTSSHWFGDTRFSLFMQKSRLAAGSAQSSRSFMGFEVSLPLGPAASQAVGPLSLRGRDQWSWGLQTKIGEKDNQLTYGYGEMPKLRHGVTTDVTDFDRNGAADLAAHAWRLRAGVRQQLPQP